MERTLHNAHYRRAYHVAQRHTRPSSPCYVDGPVYGLLSLCFPSCLAMTVGTHTLMFKTTSAQEAIRTLSSGL